MQCFISINLFHFKKLVLDSSIFFICILCDDSAKCQPISMIHKTWSYVIVMLERSNMYLWLIFPRTESGFRKRGAQNANSRGNRYWMGGPSFHNAAWWSCSRSRARAGEGHARAKRYEANPNIWTRHSTGTENIKHISYQSVKTFHEIGHFDCERTSPTYPTIIIYQNQLICPKITGPTKQLHNLFIDQ